MRIRLFGTLEVQGLEPTGLGSRKQRTLLRLLALASGRPVAVDRIVEVLWGDAPPARPADQVSVLVSRLRAALGAGRVPRGDAGYAVRYEWLDVDEVATLAAETERRLGAGDAAGARTVGLAGCRLVRGPLLADEAEPGWAAADMARVDRAVGRIRTATAAAALAAGDLPAALELANLALDADRLDEAALRIAMTALAVSGRRPAALALHERHRVIAAELLGVDLSAETDSVHGAIVRGDPIDGVPHGAVLAATAHLGAAAASLPGRGAELAALDGELLLAATHARVVVLTGEPGIGKSRLVDTWVARHPGLLTVLCRCEEGRRGLPLQPVLDGLDAALRRAGPAPARRLLGPDGDLLRRHLGAPAPAGGGGLLALPDPALARGLLGAAVVRTLERIAAATTVCVVVEDLHAADPATVDWVARLRHRAPDAALMVVVTTCDLTATAPERDRTLPLGPLDLDAVVEIVGPERANQLLARSAGNPLFLTELATAPTAALPVSLRDAITARCAALGDEVAALVQSAAVVGEQVDLDLLASVLGSSTLTVLDRLEAGVRNGILVERSGTLAFRHALVRDALEASTGAMRRAYLHREAARLLAGRGPSGCIAAARHARLGGDLALAATALTTAARLSAERAGHVEAERLLDEAIGLADTAAARLERARVRLLRATYTGAEEDARRALEMGAGAAALEVEGFAAYYRRDLARARALAAQGAAEADDPVLRAGCLLLGGRVAHAMGLVEEAEALLTDARSLAAREGLDIPGTWLGLVRVHRGHPAEALDLLRGSVHRGLPSHAFAPVHLQFVTAYALASAGRPHEAFAALTRFDEETSRRQLRRFAGRADNFRGWILRNLGDPVEADERNRRAAEEATAAGAVEAQAHALLDLADGRLQAGDLDAVPALLAAAVGLQDVEHSYRWRHGLRGSLLAGRLLLARGDAQGARDASASVAVEAARHQAERYTVLAGVLAARAAAALGEPADVEGADRLVARLGAVAPLERWWLVAELSADLRVDRWTDAAARAVATLAAQAGPRRPAFEVAAGARLRSISTAGRRG